MLAGGHPYPDLEERLFLLSHCFSQVEGLCSTTSPRGPSQAGTGEQAFSFACLPSNPEESELWSVLHVWVMWNTPWLCVLIEHIREKIKSHK